MNQCCQIGLACSLWYLDFKLLFMSDFFQIQSITVLVFCLSLSPSLPLSLYIYVYLFHMLFCVNAFFQLSIESPKQPLDIHTLELPRGDIGELIISGWHVNTHEVHAVSVLTYSVLSGSCNLFIITIASKFKIFATISYKVIRNIFSPYILFSRLNRKG